ncbi:LysE family translocator [Parabacteroides sp. OttesenSCG-928-G07]|nr:LysE family translocator [Parabacteroides sp. OttesenSCG-928-G21]MDL2277848.1 LysE family translocator [Parabacteroides sp. OttesenSCG-928-G07]
MNLWGFLTAAVLLTLLPGQDQICVIMTSISQGRKAGVILAAGLCTGLVGHVLATSLGVSFVLQSSPFAFTLLKIGGAAYLFYLGIKTFIKRKDILLKFELDKNDIQKLYQIGVLMSLMNPKLILFFLAFLPQFVDIQVGNTAIQMIILGVIFIVESFVFYLIVSALASRLTNRFMNSPRAAQNVNILVSCVYVGIGISILFI